eukprot:5287948-Alexandrium_andersonii.AAC.1
MRHGEGAHCSEPDYLLGDREPAFAVGGLRGVEEVRAPSGSSASKEDTSDTRRAPVSSDVKSLVKGA